MDDPKTTMTPDKGASNPADLASKGKSAEGWESAKPAPKGEAEKPQDELAPGPGADGALPKTG